jgi:four helix bundle protein
VRTRPAGSRPVRGLLYAVCVARDHSKLRVFTLANDLVLEVYQVTRNLPPSERYGLQSQLRRASISSSTNIVEGACRYSDLQYRRYLEISLGSACETRYLLELSINLGFLKIASCEQLITRYTELIKGLSALINKIDTDLQNS